ncbi:MAG: hypothetical protein AB1758_06960, partial [Candidatus Eremiobacterota bacterium]
MRLAWILLLLLTAPAHAFQAEEWLGKAPLWVTAVEPCRTFWLAAVILDQGHDAAVTAPLVPLALKLEDLRELEFDHWVPFEVRTPAGVRAVYQAELDKEYPDEEAFRDQRILQHLALVPREKFAIKPFMLDLMEENIAGAYDPRTDVFFVVRQPARGWGKLAAALKDPDQEASVILHEFQHALQNQHFGLLQHQKKLQKIAESDRTLAYQSLVEGDATVVMFDYLFLRQQGTTTLDMTVSFTTLGEWTMALSFLNGKRFREAPLYFQRSLIMPYLAGADFVTHVRREGGWEAVNALYDDPPVSTEQILHPERYLYGDEPVPVTLRVPERMGSWKQLREDVGGEFLVRIFL